LEDEVPYPVTIAESLEMPTCVKRLNSNKGTKSDMGICQTSYGKGIMPTWHPQLHIARSSQLGSKGCELAPRLRFIEKISEY